MRTLERWNEVQQPKLLLNFSKRIQEDLKTIPWPKAILEMTDVKSSYIQGEFESGKTIYSVFLYLQENKNLYLEGNTETNRLIFISVSELYARLKKSFDAKTRTETEFEIIDQCKDAHLLILDDMGTTKPSEWALDVLYLIINYRYEEMKKTIITSNLSLTELSEYLGDMRIPSRIQRMCQIIEKTDWKK